MPAALDPANDAQQLLIIGIAMNRVDSGRVDDQQRCCVVIVEKFCISLAETLKVMLINKLFIGNTAIGDTA